MNSSIKRNLSTILVVVLEESSNFVVRLARASRQPSNSRKEQATSFGDHGRSNRLKSPRQMFSGLLQGIDFNTDFMGQQFRNGSGLLFCPDRSFIDGFGQIIDNFWISFDELSIG